VPINLTPFKPTNLSLGLGSGGGKGDDRGRHCARGGIWRGGDM